MEFGLKVASPDGVSPSSERDEKMSTQTSTATAHSPAESGQKRILFPILQNNHVGYIDREGEIIVPSQFDAVETDQFRVVAAVSARGFHQGLAPVQVGDEWGYIGSTGKMVIDPEYEQAGTFQEGLAPVKITGKWGYIDN